MKGKGWGGYANFVKSRQPLQAPILLRLPRALPGGPTVSSKPVTGHIGRLAAIIRINFAQG